MVEIIRSEVIFLFSVVLPYFTIKDFNGIYSVGMSKFGMLRKFTIKY